MFHPGLYVHVPFCVHKCGYCDFNSWAEESLAPQIQWQEALAKQAQFWGATLLSDTRFNTVFWGGGTPSLLKAEPMQKAMEALRENFKFTHDAEWTLECNPETITPELLAHMDSLGVNRISIGIQSFEDRYLDRLERKARRADNLRALETVKKHWPHRWSMDLMFGLPEQVLQEWRAELDQALYFEPDHISAYQLTLTTARSKNWKQADNDTLLDMFLLTEDTLGAAGLLKYEVSNFSRPGHESQHNLKYWRLEPFLGLGPGASGLLSNKLLPQIVSPVPHLEQPRLGSHGAHQKQADTFEKWIQSAGFPPDELLKQLTPRSAKEHLEELLMMGLRLREGLNESRLEGLGCDPHLLFKRSQAAGNIEYNSGFWRATPQGSRVLDTVLQGLFAEIEKIEALKLDFAQIDPKF